MKHLVAVISGLKGEASGLRKVFLWPGLEVTGLGRQAGPGRSFMAWMVLRSLDWKGRQAQEGLYDQLRVFGSRLF